MRTLALLLVVATGTAAAAQDAIVIGAGADRIKAGNGAGASALWIHTHGSDAITAGAALFSFPNTRWSYATLGGIVHANARTIVNGEANVGRGDDQAGRYRYLLVRGGVTREVVPRRLYGEAEWLQIDVARRQDGIVRIGVSFTPLPPLMLRASVHRSVTGDDDTTLATFRGDYNLGRVTAIAGLSAGRAAPALVQKSGSDATRVRELFAGVTVHAWTLVVTADDDRQRVALSWRIPLREGRH